MSIFAGVLSMMEMKLPVDCSSPEGVPSLGAEANVSTNVPKKVSLEDTCRQFVTKEMKILDDIISTTKNSDRQSDYDQMNANLTLLHREQALRGYSDLCYTSDTKINSGEFVFCLTACLKDLFKSFTFLF
ncbi:hypothetical protein CDAR_23461 [Caerostris darwini]|uniref:Uncharacterized protein n=1 Tax=Caerostris darwini TaxID=1538125 RepID=A0AAV4T6V2_9ARAC|nr:hypothetical protein CDAR_23461 [Caerostris darwini]